MKSLLLTALLLLGCQSKVAPPQKTLFVFGDSIVGGEGVGPSESFVQLLAADHTDWDVRGLGAPGWSIANYLPRADDLARDLPSETKLVIVLLGTNDCRTSEPDDALVQRTRQQLGEFAQRLGAARPTARIALVAPPSVNAANLSSRLRNAGFGENSAARLKKFGPAFQEVARQRGYAFLDLFPVVSASNLPDGVHPNAAGHRQIAEAMEKAFLKGR